MTAATPSAQPQRADGTTLVCVFLLMLLLIPARLVISGISISITPATLFGIGLGLVWFCCQLVTTLGVAKGRNAARTALFLYAVSQLATYGYATRNYLPADEAAAADRTMVVIVAVICVGIAVCDGVRSLARLDVLLRLMAAGITVVAMIGVLQFAANLDLTRFLVLPGLHPATADGFVLTRSTFRRPAGTTGHPIEFGVVCAIGVPLVAHFAYRAKEAGDKSRYWWLSLVVIACGAMTSLSRSAILGLALGGLILLIGWPASRRIHVLAAAPVFVVVMRLVVPGLIGTLFSLFDNISTDPSIKGRTNDYSSAGELIAAHPLLGRGNGTYMAEKYGPLDNAYLGTLVQNGYIGLIALIVLLLSGIYAAGMARKLSRDPVVRDLALTLIACLSIIALASVTFDLLWFTTGQGLTFVLVGAAGALLRAVRALSTSTSVAKAPLVPSGVPR
jgi:O-antigen ligase